MMNGPQPYSVDFLSLLRQLSPQPQQQAQNTSIQFMPKMNVGEIPQQQNAQQNILNQRRQEGAIGQQQLQQDAGQMGIPQAGGVGNRGILFNTLAGMKDGKSFSDSFIDNTKIGIIGRALGLF